MMSSLFEVCHRQSLLTAANSEFHSDIVCRSAMSLEETYRRTKLPLKVNIEGSLGPVQVLMSLENSVKDLVKAVVEIYVKEKRRPFLHETDYRGFNLHYSQFSLESLKNDEILMNLGSRNFYLCKKPVEDQAYKMPQSSFSQAKLMEYMLQRC